MRPIQEGGRTPTKQSGNPYRSPMALNITNPASSELRGTSLVKLNRFGELLARACFGAVVLAFPTAIMLGMMSAKGLLRSDDPYLAGMFLGAIAAAFSAIDFLLGRIAWRKWMHNVASATVVAAWFAFWIYVDSQAKEGQGIGTIIACASLASAMGGLLASRVTLRLWFLWPVVIACVLFAVGLTIAQLKLVNL